MSSGVSRACPISCNTTCRSRSSSHGSKVGLVRMSPSMSSASGTSCFQDAGMEGGLLAAGIGIEMPPTASISSAMARALRAVVPLKAICSSMWEMPIWCGCLVAAAGVDPDADSGAFQPRHRIGDNRQAIGKYGYFQVHAASLEEMNRCIKAGSLARISTLSGRLFSPESRSGSGGAAPMASRHGLREFGRMGGGQDHHRRQRLSQLHRRGNTPRPCGDR